MDILVHVDALNRATTLAGVEDGSIDELSCNICKICIRANVCWVVASKLQAHRYESTRGCVANSMAAGSGSSECDELDIWQLDNLSEYVI